MHTYKWRSGFGPAVLKATLIAGTLDIVSAMIYYFLRTQKNPLRILPFISSGLFGKKALGGDEVYMISGLLFHYGIAFLFTLAFFLIYPYIPLLRKNRLLTGIGYGVLVWLIMNLVVVPFSNTPKSPFRADAAIIGMLILIMAIGIPLSFLAGRYYTRNVGQAAL